jgi:hypothetical protein
VLPLVHALDPHCTTKARTKTDRQTQGHARSQTKSSAARADWKQLTIASNRETDNRKEALSTVLAERLRAKNLVGNELLRRLGENAILF